MSRNCRTLSVSSVCFICLFLDHRTKLPPQAFAGATGCNIHTRNDSFVKSDRPHQFPNLQIKYKKGADPILKFLDADDNVAEVMSIEKWNTDTVEEFLQQHLTL
ncbi:Selenoprotein F [Holothuria leucospilota]|uniref:Selenoprotein F n=1 Tax=Holothuria leucospilota TaxID=206669 RepID=A0A9Q1HA91_HOLLE|nr:Selenoprotein F [Holothuria leucospilota]